MSKETETVSEANRLERLWGEAFGDAYVTRNQNAGERRDGFWKPLVAELAPERVLEVGCNLGGNLKWIAQAMDPRGVFGVDINVKALAELHATVPGVNGVYSVARDLPFRDRYFDLSFTMGVLIHQPESTLPLVMSEVVRTSGRYVLCGEYFAESTTEVKYRGHDGALFKRDYGKLYAELFPELRLVRRGALDAAQGFDDVTYWLFERTRG